VLVGNPPPIIEPSKTNGQSNQILKSLTIYVGAPTPENGVSESCVLSCENLKILKIEQAISSGAGGEMKVA